MRIAAATALNSINADVPVMLVVYEAMIRSTDKMSRAEGISKANRLHEKKDRHFIRDPSAEGGLS